MKSAERELLEIERKRQSSNDPTSSSSSAPAKPMSQSEIVNQKFLEITKKINDETKRLAAVRSQLQKIKAGGPLTEKVPSEKKAKAEKSADKKAAAAKDEVAAETSMNGNNEEGNNNHEGADEKDGEKGEKKKGTGQRGATFFPVPESLYPSLCK